jgi:hypothetical protein
MNTKKQGDIGVAAAILHFTELGWAVSKPLADSQRYDLIVDDGLALFRIECKTSDYIRNGKYEVKLATAGGNQSWNGVIKQISANDSDLLFIRTTAGDQYLLPTKLVDGMGSLTLGSKYEEYKL